MHLDLTNEEKITGDLFGGLFTAFEMDSFLKSVELFKKRFSDNNFDLNFFKDKKCLDVGCGGGRYSIALAMLGAREVYGIDISDIAIGDAKKRADALQINNVFFQHNSGDRIPFDSNEFDFVIFSGVLMHMQKPLDGITEVCRVIKPGGMLYGLVYATEGVRWPLINILRGIANYIGFPTFDKILKEAGLDVNKRRTFLDDLFVPHIDFYTWARLENLLLVNNLNQIDRWEKGRLDHEENLQSYTADLNSLYNLFYQGVVSKNNDDVINNLFRQGLNFCDAALKLSKEIEELSEKGKITNIEARKILIGQGHHRFTAIKKAI